MELLDRYLEAVRKHLPWERQDDIIAELRANLEAQLEEKEAGLGRALTTAEMEEWLKTLGPPIQVAAGYQPQRYLIGPAFFPMYWYVLKMALGWAAVITLIVTVVTLFTQGNVSGTEFAEAVFRIPNVLIVTAAWVTGIFVALEYAVTHHAFKLEGITTPSPNWSAGIASPFADKERGAKKPRSYAKAAAEVVFGTLFLCWLLLVPSNPWLLLGPGASILRTSPYRLPPALMEFFWCVVALNVFQLGWKFVELYRGTWRTPSRMQHIVSSVLGLVPLGLLLSVPNHMYVLLKHPELDPATLGATLDTTNGGIYKALLVISAIVVIQLVVELGKMVIEQYKRRGAAQ